MGLFIFFLMIGAFVYWMYFYNSSSKSKKNKKDKLFDCSSTASTLESNDSIMASEKSLDDIYDVLLDMIDLGKYEEAMEIYRKTSLTGENVAHFWDRLGLSLFYRKSYEGSIYCFNQSIPLDPHYVSFLVRSKAHRHLSNYIDALRDIDEAISLLTPNREHERVDLYFDRGNVLFNLDQFEESIDSFDKVNQIDCEYKIYERLMYEGMSLMFLNIREESILKFNEVLKLGERQALAYYYKGINFKYMGRYEEAIEMYDKALDEEPNLDNAFKAKQALIEELS
jgi:tetratricopeptide (TPR) repeat protein